MNKVKCQHCEAVFDKTKKGLEQLITHRADHKSGKIPKKAARGKPDVILKGVRSKQGNVAESLQPINPKIPVVNQPKAWDKKSGEVKKTEVGVSQAVVPLSSSKPRKTKILLKYVWEGNCEYCNNPVDTLHVETTGKYISLAYCMSCKKQLRERPVKKL